MVPVLTVSGRWENFRVDCCLSYLGLFFVCLAINSDSGAGRQNARAPRTEKISFSHSHVGARPALKLYVFHPHVQHIKFYNFDFFGALHTSHRIALLSL